MDILAQPQAWVALLTLAALEIVLGIDNILFIGIVSEDLPEKKRPFARVVGLSIALVFRIGLLIIVDWLIQFDKPLFHILGLGFSGHDLILFSGGVFLLVKTITEIHDKMSPEEDGKSKKESKTGKSVFGVVSMIVLIDVVFSIDSILTAVGMVKQLELMIIAIVLAMVVMIAFVNKVSDYINSNPGIQMLALSFLILISFVLILDGLHQHIPRGYVYFAFFFSSMVEFLNLRRQKNRRQARERNLIEKKLNNPEN